MSVLSAGRSGATSVSYDGKSVNYSSLDNMLRIRDIIRRALGLSPARSATVLVSHDRGFPCGDSFDDSELYSGW